MSSYREFVAGGLILVSLAGGMTGCEQSGEKLEPPVIVARPLDLDPTERIKVDGWWSNDDELLHLEIDGRFVLYPDLNRYSGPAEIGRWHRISYAVVHFEPYDSRPREQLRVAVDRRDGKIVLDVPELAAFTRLAEPPLVAEDELLGAWLCPTGRLLLEDGGHYRHQAVRAQAEPVTIAGHDGRWSLAGDQLSLDPDPPGMGPYLFILERNGEPTALRGRATRFTREPVQELP